MDLSGRPSEGRNDLYQKIKKYAYEIRMMELDEYLYGMNKKKIDNEKAYNIIIDAPDSESNPSILFWNAVLADPREPYYKSPRVEKNESKANAFYHWAVDLDIEGMAESGDQYACVCLGEMYYHGRGVDENDSTAVKWFRYAVEQGYANAQFNLGMMYLNGWGVDKNDSTAVEWFRSAAEQGHARAQFNLGWMYFIGVDENVSAAVKCYREAAEQGHANAQFHLGRMYKNGWGVDKNDSTAVEWYREAAEQGHSDAQFNLGQMYEKGWGVDRNDLTAEEWLLKSLCDLD